MVLKSNIRSSASPRPAAAAVAVAAAAAGAVASLKVYLTTLLSKVFSFSDFLGGRDGDGDVTGTGTGQTDGHMDRQTFLGKYYFRYLFHISEFERIICAFMK